MPSIQNVQILYRFMCHCFCFLPFTQGKVLINERTLNGTAPVSMAKFQVKIPNNNLTKWLIKQHEKLRKTFKVNST